MTKANDKKAAGDLSKFLTRHAAELSATSGLLRLLVNLIPMDPQNKAAARIILDGLDEAAERIAVAAPKVTEAVVSREDIVAAVEARLPDLVGGLVETKVREGIEAATAPAEGGGT